MAMFSLENLVVPCRVRNEPLNHDIKFLSIHLNSDTQCPNSQVFDTFKRTNWHFFLLTYRRFSLETCNTTIKCLRCSSKSWAIHQNVVDEHHYKLPQIWLKNPIHQRLKSRGSTGQTKWHY